MNILKTPESYAAELVAIFGTNEEALKQFNEARNADGGHIRNMPQMWCVAVAEALGAITD